MGLSAHDGRMYAQMVFQQKALNLPLGPVTLVRAGNLGPQVLPKPTLGFSPNTNDERASAGFPLQPERGPPTRSPTPQTRNHQMACFFCRASQKVFFEIPCRVRSHV